MVTGPDIELLNLKTADAIAKLDAEGYEVSSRQTGFRKVLHNWHGYAVLADDIVTVTESPRIWWRL